MAPKPVLFIHAVRRGPVLNLLLAALCAMALHCHAQVPLPVPDDDQLAWLGEQIFRNECNSRHACLTSWNAGEDFPSLGIGHFIWYRAGQQGIYAETFPALLAFMAQHGASVPAWLAAVDYEQPWPNRDSFIAAADEPRMVELRNFLAAHTGLQMAFIVSRFDRALAQLLDTVPPSDQAGLQARFNAVADASAPFGLYALVDYLNFKGEGISTSERYQGQGWGLLQVLQGMPLDSGTPLQDFVASARQVLAQRVALAPPQRQEQRWLDGWNKRLDTYLPPGISH